MTSGFVLVMVFIIKGISQPLVMTHFYDTQEACEHGKAIAVETALQMGDEEGSVTCLPVKVGKFA